MELKIHCSNYGFIKTNKAQNKNEINFSHSWLLWLLVYHFLQTPVVNLYTPFHFSSVTGQDPNRVGMLILRLSELKKANYEHTQIALEVQKQNPDVDFSDLWREMFLSKFQEPTRQQGDQLWRECMQNGCMYLSPGSKSVDGMATRSMGVAMFRNAFCSA